MTHQYQDYKRKKQVGETAKIRVIRIEQAKNEINNLQVILKAIPEDQSGARSLIMAKIGELNKLLPKFKGKIWWHWLLEYCPECKSGLSQSPLPENLGEDCELFEAVKEYDRKQADGETDYKCSCGAKSTMRYRHAIADMTPEQKQEAFAYADQASE